MSVISGIAGAVASDKAADTQAKSSDKATQAMMEMFYKSREDTQPWRSAGSWALNALVGSEGTSSTGGTSTKAGGYWTEPEYTNQITGYSTREGLNGPIQEPIYGQVLTKAPTWVPETQTTTAPSTATGGTTGLLQKGAGDFRETPGYKFRLEEGINALDKSASARGRLMSGGHEKALTKFGQDYATSEYDRNLDRYYQSLNPYMALAGLGQVSAGNSSNSAIQTGSNISENALYSGNARASGYINQANALSGASRSAVNALPYLSKIWGSGGGTTGAASSAGYLYDDAAMSTYLF